IRPRGAERVLRPAAKGTRPRPRRRRSAAALGAEARRLRCRRDRAVRAPPRDPRPARRRAPARSGAIARRRAWRARWTADRSRAGLAGERLVEQRARLAPVALHGPLAHLHDLADLLDRQPAEEAQLDDPAQAL